jgi:hypothetical protein
MSVVSSHFCTIADPDSDSLALSQNDVGIVVEFPPVSWFTSELKRFIFSFKYF